MKVLSIGNSFSEDATRYLHQIAKADGTELKSVNLNIGGCSLRTHYINCLGDTKNYMLQFNGETTGFKASIKEALISDNWDVVTLQQVSQESIKYETFQPYLDFIVKYVKKYSPKSKIYIHQTWAYEQGCIRLNQELGYDDYTKMLTDIIESYNKAFEKINADRIIPSGELFDLLIKNGISKVHRDGYHATYGLGRYALGLLWYSILCKKDIISNDFYEFDEKVLPKEQEIVKKTVQDLLQSKK